MEACGIDLQGELALHQVDVWTAHEALLLEYEEASPGAQQHHRRLVRLLGAICSGPAKRTNEPTGAHVEFLAGVHNPVG